MELYGDISCMCCIFTVFYGYVPFYIVADNTVKPCTCTIHTVHNTYVITSTYIQIIVVDLVVHIDLVDMLKNKVYE